MERWERGWRVEGGGWETAYDCNINPGGRISHAPLNLTNIIVECTILLLLCPGEIVWSFRRRLVLQTTQQQHVVVGIKHED